MKMKKIIIETLYQFFDPIFDPIILIFWGPTIVFGVFIALILSMAQS